MGVSRGTVDRALESDRAQKWQRAAGVSSFDAFAPRVREFVGEDADDAGRDAGAAGGLVPVLRRCSGRRSL